MRLRAGSRTFARVTTKYFPMRKHDILVRSPRVSSHKHPSSLNNITILVVADVTITSIAKLCKGEVDYGSGFYVSISITRSFLHFL